MPLVFTPIKARDKYLKMCREHNCAETSTARRKYIKTYLSGYRMSLWDILPSDSVTSIIEEADLALLDTNKQFEWGLLDGD